MEHAQRLISTRGGTLILAGLAALIAGVAVFVYVHNYRQSVQQGGAPATVFVAKKMIAKGTPGELVASSHLFRAQSIRESQLSQGAVVDAAALRGMVAATDIYPGTQLTTADFVAGATTIASGLRGKERAITIPIDSAHGMIGQIHTSDHVDVYGSFNIDNETKLLLLVRNIPVLVAGKSDSNATGTNTSNITLQATASQSAKMAFAADYGKVWLVLRPPTGGNAAAPDLVTVAALTRGTTPVGGKK
ncbi:MAG TPA: Flp pilus assembly protein CpaB [Gaiellaceae bacterium]|jgi:pilus assembly protein CpaB